MKKLLFALCALAAIALLTPSAGFAQWQNRIGIYTTATATATSINPIPGTFSVYFVLTNPVDNSGVPVTQVKGFEFKVNIVGPADGLIRTLEQLPASALNLGDASDPTNASYQVGLGTAIAVTDGAELDTVQLLRWNFFVTDTSAPYYFYLSPTTPATFAGKLAFLNQTNAKFAAMGSQADFADEVFAVGDATTPVAVESESFGAVKALFR